MCEAKFARCDFVMNKEEYLKRLGIEEIENECTLDVLKKLQFAHISTVPYENIDMVRGVAVSLAVGDIYKKVVDGNRGGGCFELNCLYEWLLNQFGFKTCAYFARSWRGEVGVPMKRHRIVGVMLFDNTYICDVGMGSKAPKFPLKLQDGTLQIGYGESYKIVKDKDFGWMVYGLENGEWIRYYSFFEIPANEIDFVAASYYCETHPESRFNKTYMVSLKTEKGRKTINNRDYKEFIGDNVSFIEENMSDERIDLILNEKFGICIK